MKSQNVIAFGIVLDLLDTEQFHPGMCREFHQVDHALGSRKGRSVRWAQQAKLKSRRTEPELRPMCATAGGEFSSRSLSSVWNKPWASSVIWGSDAQLHVTEHLSLCSDTATYRITQRPLLPLPGNLSKSPLHLVHAWQQTLLEETSQGTMLGQSLDPSVHVPPSPWRKEAPTTKASCGFKETLIFVISVKAFTEQLQNSGAIQDGSYQGLFVASALLSSLTHLFSNSCNGYWCLDSPALEKAQAGHGVTSFRAGRSWSSSSISTWQH